ncbi:S-adenosyl-L-methionine (SAM)-dependent methyltransferase PhcB [Salmonella enterica subsp. enterica]|nr:S-adenosyl-L-methionine (SAM)-dependent methyltransferase PhcB [Salmonella enterica subsp. enterica] [Salmonella enterica subsp. enterica serovar Menston]
MTTHSHHDNVEKQFGSQANAYLHSAVHASGRDLARLAQRLSDFSHANVLDMGMWGWTREFCRCATCQLGRGIRFIRQHA